MNDFEIVDMAFDILEDAKVVQEFDDFVHIKVDKKLWEKFQEAIK